MDTLLLTGIDMTGEIVTGNTASGYIDTLTHLPVLGSFIQTLQQLIPADWLNTANLPFLVIVFIWVLIVFWVLKDSTYRSSNGFFPIFSLLLVTIATPLIGLPIYLAIRPIGYKYKRQYWRHIMREHKKEYWKNAMEEYNYGMPETWYEPEVVQEEDDKVHLAKLQQQATLAEKRTKRTIKKSPTKRPIAVKSIKKVVKQTKSPASKTSSRKIPTAKKAVTRTRK